MTSELIPNAEPKNIDFFDFLTDACKVKREVLKLDGTVDVRFEFDPKTAKYKTQMVNSTNYAGFVFELEELENLALEAFNHMSHKRAQGFYNQIMRKVQAYQYSTDAKSSETLHDKKNKQGSLVHLVTKSRSEKNVVITDGEVKKGFLGQTKTKETQE